MKRLWMELSEGSRISWGAIRAHKMRSGLTLLGIIIGIVTVTLMGTAIEGLNGAFTRGISAMGADVLFVQRFAWFRGDQEWWKVRNRKPITYKLAKAVQKEMTLARAVTPAAFNYQFVNRGVRSGASVNIIGTTEDYAVTEGLNMGDGRFLSSIDVLGGRPVCVIGYGVGAKLFPRESPLGKPLSIGGRNYEVVGVVEKRGNFLGLFSLDDEVIIPITQYIGAFEDDPDLLIQVKSPSMGQIEETNEELEGLLRKLRKIPPGKEDDFAINRQSLFIDNFKRVGGTIASIGIFITGLSLFVGGIGIMNIMFVSVTERTREIGLRKALGARRRTILLQFLIEASMICLLGGVVALAITFPVSLIVSRFLPTSMSWVVIGLALLVSVLTGLISGFMPAYRASKMSPVEALRSE